MTDPVVFAPPPPPPPPVASQKGPEPVVASFSIEEPAITVVKAEEPKPKRTRRTKAEIEAERAAKEAPSTRPAAEEETGRLIRVRTVKPFNLYCHPQQKTIHAGFDVQVIEDAWVRTQIAKGILVKAP